MDDSIDLFRAMFFNPFLIRVSLSSRSLVFLSFVDPSNFISPLPPQCSFILFLNKKDLFELKLRHVPLHRFYPAFEGLSIHSLIREIAPIRPIFVPFHFPFPFLDRTKNITSDSAYAEAVGGGNWEKRNGLKKAQLTNRWNL